MADSAKFPGGSGNQELNIQKASATSTVAFLSEAHQRTQFLPNYFVS